jgi:RHS repeat-associated protein
MRTMLTPAAGTPQRFVWDTVTNGSTVPQLLSDSTTAYIYGPNTNGAGSAPIEQIAMPLATGAPSYLFSDPQGVRTLFSTTGAKENGYTYSAYGERATGATPTGSTPFGFEGGYTDPSGLEYLVHRYYTPKVGQFLSVDPTVLRTVQAYAYANDDPVNMSDASGMCSSCAADAAVAALAGTGAALGLLSFSLFAVSAFIPGGLLFAPFYGTILAGISLGIGAGGALAAVSSGNANGTTLYNGARTAASGFKYAAPVGVSSGLSDALSATGPLGLVTALPSLLSFATCVKTSS